MSDLKLSIIVPVYNAAKYIEKTVESLHVEGKDYELILVDDCSRDDSPALCDKLAQKYNNIKVIHKPQNEGLSLARNTGIYAAQGEYLCFVDSDDSYAESDAVRKIIDGVQEDRDVYFINMDKSFSDGSRVPVNNFRGKIRSNPSEKDICEMIANEKSAPVSASTKILKRELVLQNDLVFKPGIFSEDIEWFFRVIYSGIMKKSGYIDITYLYYQGNAGSITKNVSEKNVNDLLDMLEPVLTVADESDNCRENCVKQIAAFETMITIYNWSSLKKDAKKRTKSRLESIIKLMRHTGDIRVKATYIFSKIFGLGLTSQLLAIARR